MTHFSEQLFVDLVRGVDASSGKEMQSHLTSDCPQCMETFELWNQLKNVADRESGYFPPSDAVRIAKLAFEMNCVQEGALTANLLFDSLTQPALVGVRSTGAMAARQMVFDGNGLTVDLRFDRQPGSDSVLLIGQVLDPKSPRASIAEATVMLWTEKGLVLAETRTDGLGEFHLEFEAQNRLRLSIQAMAGKLIRIPLANLKTNDETKGITDGTGAGYH